MDAMAGYRSLSLPSTKVRHASRTGAARNCCVCNTLNAGRNAVGVAIRRLVEAMKQPVTRGLSQQHRRVCHSCLPQWPCVFGWALAMAGHCQCSPTGLLSS